MPDCIFCQIVQGGLPCAKIYEDDRVISFLDISPVASGHTLVLPKDHYETIFDVPEDLLQACTCVSQKVARAVFRGTNASGLNVLQNNFRHGGQLIDHVHFHIIPRFPQDNFLNAWPRKPYLLGEMEKIMKKIRSQFEPTYVESDRR